MRIVINGLQYKQKSSGIGVMIRELFGAYSRLTERKCQVFMPKDAPEMPLSEVSEEVRLGFAYGASLRRMFFQTFGLGGYCKETVLLTTDSKVPFRLPKSCVVLPLITDLALYRLSETYKLSRVLWWRLQYRYLCWRADRFLAVSEFTKREMAAILHIATEKIEVVPCACGRQFQPVRDEKKLAAVRKKYGLPERFVLFVGNFNPRKNLERLIQSFDMLKEQGDVVQNLVIAGEQGWKFNKTNALAEIKHKGNIHFCGFVADEDMPTLYSAADLFVFPTLYEGFGIPVLEAQSCGTPVLTSNCSSLPEVAGSGAVYVEPYSVASIAEGMKRVLRDENLRQEMISLGLANVKRFSWESSAERLQEIVEEEIAKREDV